jgi:GT2 family glycosyltransferase
MKNKATICIVNYKTLLFTTLCLRSIRKFTEYPYEVIVIDNDSQDDSLEYLKSLNWIKLIERPPEPDKPMGGYNHAASLDLGLKNCTTEYFVTLHSDTFIRKNNWLGDLISYFQNDENIACVGSGKIEIRPEWQMLLKKITDFRTLRRKLLHKPDPIGKFRYYNRTICCLYRTEILRKENLSFRMDYINGLTVGKKLYFELVDRGYKTVELPSALMGMYVYHVGHGTQVINSKLYSIRKKTIRKGKRIASKITTSSLCQQIYSDNTLDR